MGIVDGVTYGLAEWRTDSVAALEEAERRIAVVLADPAQTSLFLSDLFALEELPASLARCSHLQELDIGDAFGPDGDDYETDDRRFLAGWGHLAGLTSLRRLSLAWTNCDDFSPLTGLRALQGLTCWGTQIRDLSPLSGLRALQSLDCSGTQILDLSPLSGLRALQSLDCWGTQISDLSALSGLSALQSLNCSYTQISDLSPLSGLSALQSLNCLGTQISDLSALSGLSALQSLDFSRTQISDLSPLSGLSALQSLDCSYTQISDLSPLSGLSALQSLNCWKTRISDLSPLSGLSALQSLNCWKTRISDLSPLSGLSALQSLDCLATQISDLSPLSSMSALQSLNCSWTAIRDISLLKSCRALKSLSLNGCALDTLPGDLIWSECLSELKAYDAHIRGIPDEVLSQNYFDNCLPDLRAHLTDLGEDPEPLGDVKLSVLGNGRIGKTQICNRLRDLPFEPEADSTHGIVLSTAPIPDSPHVFNLWDFGGQDIYHGTHALFLKSRAIFLLVWTPETDNHDTVADKASGMIFRNQKLDWWLDYVRRFGSPQSPLIVMQNQIDVTPDNGEHPAVVALRGEREGGFCRSMGYSAKARTGHPTLLDNLAQAVARFNPPLIGKGRKAMIAHLRALRDADARRPVAERLHRLMPLADFEADCARIGGISNPRLFLQFLHNAGEVFWREGYFNDQIILDQAWVLEAVYTVFNREKCVTILTQQEGRFSADLLDALVWGSAGYSEAEQGLFLQFMVSSGICFEVKSSSGNRYIAPDYLPEVDAEQAVIHIDRSAGRCLRFDSLPPLLMRNLISRVGQEAGVHGHYWRNGVLFFDTDLRSRVLIEQSCTRDWRGEIRIIAEGGDAPKAMETAITAVVEEAQRLGVSPEDEHLSAKDSKMSAGPDPAKPDSYYVSYAWDDEKDPASANISKIVDDLCAEATKRGIVVHRDKDEVKFGDRISEFMARLARGDRVIVILSDRYFKSRSCMSELYELWMQTRAEDASFLEKVRIFTHPGTKISTPVERAKVAKYWADLYEDEKPYLEHMGAGDRVSHLALKKYAAHVGDILSLVSDTFQPRDLNGPYMFD